MIVEISLCGFGSIVAFVLLFGFEASCFGAGHFAFDLSFENAWSYRIMNAFFIDIKVFFKSNHAVIYAEMVEVWGVEPQCLNIYTNSLHA